jgi:hydrogenase maturation factor
MCIGTVARLDRVVDDGAARAGLLDGGALVSLAFVPDAEPGDHLLLHLGVPVEVVILEPEGELP